MGAERKHKITEFKGDTVACACGWHYREHKANEYGVASLRDRLLDFYNAHRADK